MRRWFAAGSAVAIAVVVAACFPDVTFNFGSSTGAGGNPTSSTHSSTASSSHSSSGTTTAQTTSSVSTGTSQLTCGEAAGCSDASKCLKICLTQDKCDCDGDGYYLNTPECATKAANNPSMYKGKDCYDCNASANPMATNYFPVDRGDGSYDYNCDGSAEEQVTATGCGSPSGNNCPVSFFFTPDPHCGNSGPTMNCTYNVSVLTASCMQTSGSMQVQKCR